MAVACGTSDGPYSPFDREMCPAAWGQNLRWCDRQCMSHESDFTNGNLEGSSTGPLCYSAVRPDSPDITCNSTFADGYGLTGCCIIEYDGSGGPIVGGKTQTGGDAVHFYECP